MRRPSPPSPSARPRSGRRTSAAPTSRSPSTGRRSSVVTRARRASTRFRSPGACRFRRRIGTFSSRHARIEQLGDTLVVTDLGSTNGIDVHWSEGPVRRLRPGETSVVLPDAVVAIGDAVVVEFVAAATL
ncbi:MAG: FHA domain-containing protein [Microcella pacifica]